MSDLDLSRFLPEGLAGLSAYDPPGGDYPVRLDANENPYPPDPVLAGRIQKAVDGIELNRYPDPASRDLRAAFADLFGCPAENVMAGNGSDELIGLLLWTLRRRPGGGRPVVMIPVPTFAMYSIAAVAAGYEVCEVPLGPRMEPDMEGLLRAAREKRPNITFLSNPNNPTGTSYSREQIHALLSSPAGLVVVDEAYGDFSTEPSQVPQVASAGNLAVLRTLSKVGAAALRCGFLAAGTHLLGEVNKVRSPFNLNRHTQVAGEIILRNYGLVTPQAAALVQERERLAGRLAGLGLHVFPSQGNFLLVRCGGREPELWKFLQDGGIVVKFLSRLPVAGDALRITVGTPGENSLLVSRITEFLR